MVPSRALCPPANLLQILLFFFFFDRTLAANAICAVALGHFLRSNPKKTHACGWLKCHAKWQSKRVGLRYFLRPTKLRSRWSREENFEAQERHLDQEVVHADRFIPRFVQSLNFFKAYLYSHNMTTWTSCWYCAWYRLVNFNTHKHNRRGANGLQPPFTGDRQGLPHTKLRDHVRSSSALSAF